VALGRQISLPAGKGLLQSNTRPRSPSSGRRVHTLDEKDCFRLRRQKIQKLVLITLDWPSQSYENVTPTSDQIIQQSKPPVNFAADEQSNKSNLLTSSRLDSFKQSLEKRGIEGKGQQIIANSLKFTSTQSYDSNLKSLQYYPAVRSIPNLINFLAEEQSKKKSG
jgi:hypothetical protein